MKIRRWDSLGGHWRLQALFALLVESMNSDATASKSFVHCACFSLLFAKVK